MATSPETWKAIKELFEAALEQEPASRSSFLGQRCQDASVRAEVGRLLAEHEQAGTFLSTPPLAEFALAGLATPPKTLAAGTRLGAYTIQSTLGVGGMGEVYRARDAKLDRDVAVKVLPAEMALDAERLARFRREAKALAQLDHPNIVTIYSVEEADGVNFLTMQLVEGKSLDCLIPAGGFPVERLVEIATALGDAVAAAHEKGIVHRDLKPANVMVSDGRVKVLDFGLARAVGGTNPGDTTLTVHTQAGLVMGTPAYMSPEQASGRPVDHRTDIFSLGVVLHEMVTGKRPFDGTSSAELISAILRDTPPSVTHIRPELPEALARIIRHCLEKDPRDRVQTARDISNGFRDLRRDISPNAAQTTFSAVPAIRPNAWNAAPAEDGLGVAALPTHAKRHRASFAAVGLILAAIGAVGGYEWRKTSAFAGAPTLGVIGFKNNSGDPRYDWLATELSESLTTELGGSKGIRTVPTDEISSVKTELSVNQSQSLEREDLSTVRQALGADYLLLGRYVVFSPGSNLDMNVVLQDSAGKTVGEIHESGSTADYRKLIEGAASQIREKLGSARLSANQVSELQNLYPTVPEASHLYFQALDKLRSFDATAALSLLKKASDLDPDNVSIHWALSEAWVQLKHDVDAAQEAQKASMLAEKDSLPQEYVVLAQARAAEMNKQWDAAIEHYKSLSALFPQNLNYGLSLASVQIGGSKATDALATLDKLAKLPEPTGSDPRIEMTKARAYGVMNDYRSQLLAAQTGLQAAQRRNARMMQARAQLELCWAHRNLGDVDAAYTACNQAQILFSAFNDNVSAAEALNDTATWLSDRGRYAEAKQLYDQVIRVNQEAGAQIDLAGAYVNAAKMLDRLDKTDEAEDYIKRALDVALPIGDKYDEALARILKGEILSKRGNALAAQVEVQSALTLAREIKDQSTEATALSNLAQYQAETDTGKALTSYGEALHLRQQKGDRAAVAICLTNMGDVLFRRGSLGKAEENYRKALQTDTELKDKASIASDWVSLAVVELEDGKPREAQDKLLLALKEFRERNDVDSEELATSMLLRVFLAEKDMPSAAAALQRLGQIGSKDLETEFNSRLSAADYLNSAGKGDEAIEKIASLPMEAKNAGMNFLALKARLKLVQLQAGRRSALDLRTEVSAIQREAQRAGFGLLLHQAKAIGL